MATFSHQQENAARDERTAAEISRKFASGRRCLFAARAEVHARVLRAEPVGSCKVVPLPTNLRDETRFALEPSQKADFAPPPRRFREFNRDLSHMFSRKNSKSTLVKMRKSPRNTSRCSALSKKGSRMSTKRSSPRTRRVSQGCADEWCCGYHKRNECESATHRYLVGKRNTGRCKWHTDECRAISDVGRLPGRKRSKKRCVSPKDGSRRLLSKKRCGREWCSGYSTKRICDEADHEFQARDVAKKMRCAWGKPGHCSIRKFEGAVSGARPSVRRPERRKSRRRHWKRATKTRTG